MLDARRWHQCASCGWDAGDFCHFGQPLRSRAPPVEAQLPPFPSHLALFAPLPPLQKSRVTSPQIIRNKGVRHVFEQLRLKYLRLGSTEFSRKGLWPERHLTCCKSYGVPLLAGFARSGLGKPEAKHGHEGLAKNRAVGARNWPGYIPRSQ